MIRFDSDYIEGCIPEILEALQNTNEEQTIGYGVDPHCENARALIRKAIGREDSDVHFLVGGTQANITVITSVLKHYQGAVCAVTGHINEHETGALEACGHKCLTIPSDNGTLTAQQVDQLIYDHYHGSAVEHTVQPGLAYISFPTELGTLYSKKQLEELYAVCRKHDIPLFIDGARLGYALASKKNDMTLQDIANHCDMFYIGGTKVGALFGEAVVITNPAYKKDFRYNIKQRGGMLAKGRLLGIQFEQLFTDDRYMKVSRHCMAMAERLTEGFASKGYSFAFEAETNQLFPILPDAKAEELAKEFAFTPWGRVDENHQIFRFVTSFMTKPESVDHLIEML